ncbi:STAS domain-containing protein [Streptomyces sp. OfavH-34-F]|uniref:STAS domain-containing protein n=1 Tax=Streptomyces sp. OfavH-34-F TaxID=2917760 RepID=UPI001EF2418C|nr:STAS domain-containing protein [Streptomyces sp. OfavH-34-F]MCG7523619.1 STAS domain-containing protein [Streptomyces sp. OfavH-34-F]
MSSLTITTRDAATGPVLEVTGDLDHYTAPGMRAALDGLAIAEGQLLVVDLTGLEFCDSSGIGALLSVRSLVGERGGTMALAAVPANTARIMRIIGLDQVFTIHPDAATATASAAR